MRHLSSFALALAAFLPVLAACSGTATEVPSDDDTSTVDSEVNAGKPGPAKLTCAEVFGTCVALTPGSCAGGTWADANVVSCGGGIGVGCCVRPTPPPPPPAPPPYVCPELTPPAPGFCPGGKITARKNEHGCTVGFDCVPPPPVPSCAAAGGTCVGLYPGACPSGNWGAPSTHACGPGIGVGCCLP